MVSEILLSVFHPEWYAKQNGSSHVLLKKKQLKTYKSKYTHISC